MNHLDEQQLIDYCGGDAAEREAIEQHLGDCPACRARCQSLQQVLSLAAALPVPEPHPSYESRLWHSLRPQLETRNQRGNWREWFTVRRLVPMGAMAGMILAAFLAGRYSPRPGVVVPHGGEGQAESLSHAPQVRERILLVAVGDHLDRAQSILLEISNTEAAAEGDAPVDISREQQRAQALLSANRLYRQTAGQTGDAAVASVLGELEPLLAEIANSSGQVPASDLEELRRRIAARGLLLKVRVLGSTVRERQLAVAPAAEPGKS
jgi:hypothetical protein